MNDQRAFWQQLQAALERGGACVLLSVVESIGSSPGRTGFKMFVSASGTIHGSIGGGSMEHKLVELARSLMDKPQELPFLKRQIHQAGIGQDRSGMICSGEQTVAFHLLRDPALCTEVLRAMDEGSRSDLIISSEGISVGEGLSHGSAWSYRAPLSTRPRVVIVGGGHVGTALSRTMAQLGFHVTQFDHREELNTMEANAWAHEKRVIDLARIGDHVPDDPGLFIALVSFGYRTDGIALRQLIRRPYRYLGLLGSAEKVRILFEELRTDGFTDEELARVHAPIGIPINSHTPEEIAVSIAAEIISVKNGDPRNWVGT